jgi:8-oxo-dGTP pyrophosphatase MutT (NUDIX family)
MKKQMDFPWVIRDVLNSRTPRMIKDKHPLRRHAAVLVPLFKVHDQYRVLFTKRTDRVEEHKGQISFPGGAVEEGDESFQDTALREAYEEIGLLRKDVAILGQTDDTLTLASNFVIHTFVGLIPHPYCFKVNDHEVKRLIEFPFDVFMVENQADKMGDVKYDGNVYRSVIFQYNGDVIWGATAKIMENLIEILGRKNINLHLKRT